MSSINPDRGVSQTNLPGDMQVGNRSGEKSEVQGRMDGAKNSPPPKKAGNSLVLATNRKQATVNKQAGIPPQSPGNVVKGSGSGQGLELGNLDPKNTAIDPPEQTSNVSSTGGSDSAAGPQPPKLSARARIAKAFHLFATRGKRSKASKNLKEYIQTGKGDQQQLQTDLYLLVKLEGRGSKNSLVQEFISKIDGQHGSENINILEQLGQLESRSDRSYVRKARDLLTPHTKENSGVNLDQGTRNSLKAALDRGDKKEIRKFLNDKVESHVTSMLNTGKASFFSEKRTQARKDRFKAKFGAAVKTIQNGLKGKGGGKKSTLTQNLNKRVVNNSKIRGGACFSDMWRRGDKLTVRIIDTDGSERTKQGNKNRPAIANNFLLKEVCASLSDTDTPQLLEDTENHDVGAYEAVGKNLDNDKSTKTFKFVAANAQMAVTGNLPEIALPILQQAQTDSTGPLNLDFKDPNMSYEWVIDKQNNTATYTVSIPLKAGEKPNYGEQDTREAIGAVTYSHTLTLSDMEVQSTAVSFQTQI